MTLQVKFVNIQNNFPVHQHICTDGYKQGLNLGCGAIFKNQKLLKGVLNELSIYCAEVTAIDPTNNIIANYKSSKFIIHSDSK